MSDITVDPRDEFEKVFPLPKHVIRCGKGYACTEYNAWGAHNFIRQWEGWSAAMLQGADVNSPDGWVACSERMPEDGEKVLTSFRGGMRTAVCKVVDVLGHKIFVDELALFNGVPAEYWQPLPAAPHFREILNSSTNNFRENAETSTKCWCHTCRPVTISDMRFVVCPECGNKRCPHANDHRNACTGSNEPGQEGSAYPAAPQQGVTQALAKGMERYGSAMQELAKREVKS